MTNVRTILAAGTVALASSVPAQDMKPDPTTIQSATEAAHFHHIRLKVTDPQRTLDFYKKFFGATEVAYRGQSRALFTEKSFVLLDKVVSAPATNEGTSLWHIGWGGVDGASEFGWRVAEGIQVQRPLTRPVLDGVDNKAEYMYFWGPDRELVEVSTASRNHRFDHVHLLSSDAEATTAWFKEYLGLTADFGASVYFNGVMMNIVRADNVSIVIFARPTPDSGNQFAAKALWPSAGFQPTDGRAVSSIAFSYRDLAPVMARMKKAGLSIVREIETDPRHGHTSFLVRGPDQLLVEIVEEKSVPEGIWSR